LTAQVQSGALLGKEFREGSDMRQVSVVVICLMVAADLGMAGQTMHDRAINWDFGIPIIVGNLIGIALLFFQSRVEE
jgi:hypothetical protein